MIIADIEDRKDLVLITDEVAVEFILRHLGIPPEEWEYDGLFVKIEDGEIKEVYGFPGIVPALSKPLYRLL